MTPTAFKSHKTLWFPLSRTTVLDQVPFNAVLFSCFAGKMVPELQGEVMHHIVVRLQRTVLPAPIKCDGAAGVQRCGGPAGPVNAVDSEPLR